MQTKQSTIASRWASISAKQDEFNKLYPAEATANCYVGRNDKTWITYNPNKTGGEVGGVFTLKYNTCKTFDIKHQLYGTAVFSEYSDHIDVYMNNYDEDAVDTLKTETIQITGASAKPSFTAKDRGVNQTKSQITESWDNGTYTLTVKHNGPVDLSIQFAGNETGRLTAPANTKPGTVEFPGFYTGTRQCEGENFDMKNVEGNVTNGCNSGISKYWGMGFVKFGTKDSAAVKDSVNTTKAGSFKWTPRYSATSDVNCVDLCVNGAKVRTLSLPKGMPEPAPPFPPVICAAWTLPATHFLLLFSGFHAIIRNNLFCKGGVQNAPMVQTFMCRAGHPCNAAFVRKRSGFHTVRSAVCSRSCGQRPDRRAKQ